MGAGESETDDRDGGTGRGNVDHDFANVGPSGEVPARNTGGGSRGEIAIPRLARAVTEPCARQHRERAISLRIIRRDADGTSARVAVTLTESCRKVPAIDADDKGEASRNN